MSAQPDYPGRNNPSSGWSAIRRRLIRSAVTIALLSIAGFVIWTWITLHFSYSSGQRVGYIQKISKKGWVCKTWEGELAMLNQPGVPAQIFKSGEMLVNVASVLNALICEVEYAPTSVGVTSPVWTKITVATARKPVKFENLTPGSTYMFQVRAFGKLGFTDWSTPVQRMCI